LRLLRHGLIVALEPGFSNRILTLVFQNYGAVTVIVYWPISAP
jgi:hypothetical protein